MNSVAAFENPRRFCGQMLLTAGIAKIAKKYREGRRGHRALRMPLLVVFLFLLRLSNAQTCSHNTIVNVLDAHGLPISNLAGSNFKAFYRGKPVAILSASFRSDPTTRTFLLLDTAASMGGNGAQGINKWKIARSAASEFLLAVPPETEVSLFTFSATVEKTFSSKDGRKPMQDWVDSPESLKAFSHRGKAALHRTLLEMVMALEPNRPGDSIYVITDGRNDDKFSMASNVADELQSNGVRLFSFALDDVSGSDYYSLDEGQHTSSVPPPSAGPSELAGLVRSSGGLEFTLHPGGNRIGQSFGTMSYDYSERSRQAVRVAGNEFEAAISNFYILTVGLPEDARGLADLKIEVVDARGRQRKDVTVGYPSRIPGCAAGPGSR
jgi:hypothetical protein